MSSAAGKCCVCTAPTSNRCGACQQAGVDVFLCSREHQKLVYFAHKQVCGEKANPFIWPDLTEEEAEDAIKHLEEVPMVPMISFPLGSVKTDVTAKYPELARDIPSLLRSLVDPNSPHPPELRQHLLILVRGAEQRRRMMHVTSLTPSSGKALEVVHNPFDLSAAGLCNYLDDVGGPFPLHAPWFVAMQHQFLVQSALNYRMMAGRDGDDGVSLYTSSKRLVPELFDAIEKTEPAVAKSLKYTHEYLNWGKEGRKGGGGGCRVS